MSKFDELEKYEELSKRLNILVKQLGEVMTPDGTLITKEEIQHFESIRKLIEKHNESEKV